MHPDTITIERLDDLEAALKMSVATIHRLRLEVQTGLADPEYAAAAVNETVDSLTRITID